MQSKVCIRIKAHYQCNRKCALESTHIISAIESVHQNRGTLSVQSKVCIRIDAHYQCNRKCALESRHIISAIESVH